MIKFVYFKMYYYFVVKVRGEINWKSKCCKDVGKLFIYVVKYSKYGLWSI